MLKFSFGIAAVLVVAVADFQVGGAAWRDGHHISV